MHGSVWIASYVALWAAVLVLSFAVVALLRQLGVLHARLAPMGTHFAGEGPDLDSAAPAVGLAYDRAVLTVLAFTSPSCTVCHELRPSLDALRRQYRELQVHVVDLEPTTQPVFDAFLVRSTPYIVTVDRSGVVRGRGVANTLEQVEELVRESKLASAGADA
jgi:thiol-disulfide isomerase/thioredoxin